jgi:3-hydroxyacyl-CoA dehydrogenase/enoyl-CoA hydratase/3-hydroxybutyryl-CoA epimerase
MRPAISPVFSRTKYRHFWHENQGDPFVEDLGRLGRKRGGGFYEYPGNEPKHLWHGLTDQYPRAATQPCVDTIRQRLLHVQALEAARCFEANVVTTAAEADIGSILGVGFPAWTGGALSYIDTLGAARFVADCKKLERLHGERFRVGPGLAARAKNNRPFHAPGA